MEDARGLYYYPRPGITAVRVYVRRGPEKSVEFRMWDADHPEVWERHGWIPLSVITKAAAMYREKRGPLGGDPMNVYDSVVAESLLRGKEGR